MAVNSAGLLLFRETSAEIEVLLVHPGGPFWKNKDDGAWSIPKGLCEPGEDLLVAARREFEEETGFAVPEEAIALAPLRQPGGKIVNAWAVRRDLDAAAARSNTFLMEWPPGSGRQREFPEADRAAWFPLSMARRKILKGQAAFLDQLERKLAENDGGSETPRKRGA
jgi:predicted NUDIX family NTP pyrophosphohydrolase